VAFERSQKDPPTKNKCVESLVNENTRYEQLIAAKLDQVPVPDMVDSIWAGIEVELGAPGDGGEPGSADARDSARSADAPGPGGLASAFKRIGWYVLAGIVAVAALLLWYFVHKGPKDKVLPEIHAPVPVTPSPDSAMPASPMPGKPSPAQDSPSSDKPAKKKNLPVLPAETRKDTVSSHNVLGDSVRADSAARQVLPPIKVDSGSLQKKRPALPDVDLYAIPPPSVPGGKKHKGVKGITEDDYKITASKDSARKRN